ncbi:hypothetical protein PTTG_30384 [Puccinia triticina 1-1 BBBD Race 1]|uniref:Uncharacterized protein n=1 Tax=Puccinia triticina (isolate 1-1 / race 1 (BBBD)) TaxID=630390 RepID=A0A180FZ33_PUCT1|nr:hypothetical protein PTTG_30384 [Puccinia triticina 1-1 BBBD Race 1]
METNRKVRSNFYKLVRELQRRLRLAIRERLLANIVTPAGDLIEEGNVPNLHQLARSIFCFLHPDEATMTDSEVDDNIPVLLLTRIGHLRLQTIDRLLHSEIKKVSQWNMINKTLREVRGRGSDYQAAFGKAILAKDHALFGHSRSFVEILEEDEENIKMPDDDKIQVQLNQIIREQLRARHS